MDVSQLNTNPSNIINILKAKMPNDVTYWRVDKIKFPAPIKVSTLPLSGPNIQHVTLDLSPENRFVYWPDYKVAGRIQDIAKFFISHSYPYVQVGELSRISNGELGTIGIFPVTPQLIRENSFDPLNAFHQNFIRRVNNFYKNKSSPKSVEIKNIPSYKIYNTEKVGQVLADQLDKIVIIYWKSHYSINPRFFLFDKQQSYGAIVNLLTRGQYPLYHVFKDYDLRRYPDVSFVSFRDNNLVINISTNGQEENYKFVDPEIYNTVADELISMSSPIEELFLTQDLLY